MVKSHGGLHRCPAFGCSFALLLDRAAPRFACGHAALLLLSLASMPVWGAQKDTPEGLRSGVLMGMRIEAIDRRDDGARVVTTGAEFVLEKAGQIRCFQRIPERRQIAEIELPPETLPVRLEEQNDFACRGSTKGLSLTLQGDSLAILRAEQDIKLGVKGLFRPAYQAEKQGRWLFIDAKGGFGIYPTGPQKTITPDFGRSGWAVAYELRKGEELWISLFPPRPYNWKRAYEDRMAHEGNEPPYAYPGTALIQSTARYCKVMVVHSWFWPGGDREPWKIPTFVPKDPREFFRVRDDLHRAGMKMVPYFSPYYYSGRDFFAEVRRALDEYKVDGLYFDGVSMDFRTSYDIVRQTRALLGDDRILFRHCTSDPLASARIYCPFIDTYCDYIYRGEAGRADLELDDFLRWTLSGYNISNAVGYWVYTGSTGKPGYVRQAPTREHIDAALRHEVRLPRTEIGYELNLAWKPNDGHLEFFDTYYYRELARIRAALKK